MPELERICLLFGLKYFPFLPIHTYFIEEKNFFIKLFRKFNGRYVSLSLAELSAERSTVRTGLQVILYFYPSK